MNALPQSGLNAFKAGLASGGPTGAGGSPPATTATPFTPPTPKPAPPQVSVPMPQGRGAEMFQPGANIHGQVTGQQNGQFMLRLGDLMLKADARVPLKVGDLVQFQVQGENKGQVHLKLLSTPFEKMSMTDLSQTLTSLKMPLDEKSMNLAKTMVELKIPLTKENLTQMKQSLAQTSPTTNAASTAGPNATGPTTTATLPNRVAATNFLQNSQLPVTPQSVGTLSNFIANHPQAGQQMMSLNTEFKKLSETTHKMGKEVTDMIAKVQDGMKTVVLEPKTRQNKDEQNSLNLANLKGMAKQSGIKTNMGPAGMGGGEEWDFPELLRKLRDRMKGDGLGSDELYALMEGLEGNLEAQRLINMAKPESTVGYYYLQLPFNIEGFRDAEVWLQYTEEGDGSRYVDPDDTRLEFFVKTDEMGQLHFVVDLRDGKVHVDMGTPSHEVRQFAARYLPALAERLAGLGWAPGRFRSHFRPHTGKRELVEHTDFENLERCNVSA